MRMNLKRCSCRLRVSALCPKMWLSTSMVEHLLTAADTYTCPGTYWTGMSSTSLSTIVSDPLVGSFLSPKCMIKILFYSCWSWTDDSFTELFLLDTFNIWSHLVLHITFMIKQYTTYYYVYLPLKRGLHLNKLLTP